MKTLKALRQPNQKFWPKILTSYFLQQSLPWLPKTMQCKYFQNCVYSFRENWEVNLRIWHICSSLQLVVVYNFSKIKSIFLVPFWDYAVECLWLRSMVSIYLKRKDKYDWFLHKRVFSRFAVFLYLLQSGSCSKYSAKATNCSILNLFLHFLQPFVMKHFRVFNTVMWFKFHCLIRSFTRGT